MATELEKSVGGFGSRPQGATRARRRVQVNDPTPVEPLRPRAVPVDLFVAPLIIDDPQPTALQTLAGALKEFEPKFKKFAAEKQKQFEDAEIAAGIRRYNELRVSFREAVANGDIPPNASPFFQNAFESQELRNEGSKFELSLRTAFAKSPAANSDDPAVFDAFNAQFLTKYMEEKDLKRFGDTQIVESFLPEVSRSQRILQQRHVEARAAAIESGLLEKFSEGTIFTVDRGLDEDKSPQEIGDAITAQMDELIAGGLDPKKANKALIETVTNKAEAEGDMEVLKILDSIRTSTGSRLSGTKFARQEIDNAKDKITLDADRRRTRDNSILDRQRKELSRSALIDAFSKLAKDKTSNIAPNLAELARLNPAAASNLLSFQQALLNSDAIVREDPETIAFLYTALNTAENGPELIAQAAKDGQLDVRTVQDAMRYWQRNQKFSGPFNLQVYKRVDKGLVRAMEATTGIQPAKQGNIVAAIIASQELRKRTQVWLEENTSEDKPLNEKDFAAFLTQEWQVIFEESRFDKFNVTGKGVLQEINPSAKNFPGIPSPVLAPRAPAGTSSTNVGTSPNPFDQFDTQ